MKGKKREGLRIGAGGGVLLMTVAAALIFGWIGSSLSGTVTKREIGSAVSPALCVLAAENDMAMAGLVGGTISFAHDDFARAVNLESISSLTVTEVPPVTDGELRLGSTVVLAGTRISANQLSFLRYVPRSEEMRSSFFRFRVNDSPVDMACKLYFLDSVNASPTLSRAPKTSLQVSTHQNITLYGTLPCYDPEGDETRIEIVSYPEEGTLILTDRATGEYRYVPKENASGRDSFTYVARDRYGNYSAAATVSLTVTKPSLSLTYEDMIDSPYYNAALTMAEEGILMGDRVGERFYFSPDRAVSRGEFVVMAMKAMGMTGLSGETATVFFDDNALSEEQRSFVAAAYRLGYVRGESDGEGRLCFSPRRAITRAEAAVMLSKMMNADAPTFRPTFSDSSEIPAWAQTSVYALSELGVLSAFDGSVWPASSVTRADAASMLAAVLSLRESD